METKATESEIKRDEAGLYLPGNPPGPGRPPETEEKKLMKRAIKEFIEEHKQTLAESLPKLAPALIEKALTGDVPAIKEVHDRVMGKSVQPIQGNLNITNDASDEIDKGVL